MSASTAPAVKAQLLTLLRADSGLSGVGMDYGDPGQEIQQEALFFGRVHEHERPDAMGQRSQREEYDIEVFIYVAVDGNDAQTCEERCWALVARLESVVRANNGRQGALSTALNPAGGWVVYGGTEMTPFVHEAQRVNEALCRVHVVAIK